MAQGDNKTGQKGTNAIFVTNYDDITKILKAGKKFTYANLMVDHRPQKEDPNRIRITAGGNLIDNTRELSVPTANIDTAKLHWNSVVSTALAKYMCINIKSFYLSAALEYYEYMKIPYALFPQLTIKQYGLEKHKHNGYIFFEIHRAVWGLLQAGILTNKKL